MSSLQTRPFSVLPRSARILLFTFYFYTWLLRDGFAEDHISVKWQDYSEDDDRIRVISRYLGVEKEINSSFTLKAHGVHDAISGATPTGVPAEDGVEVPLSNLTDQRTSGVVDLVWTKDIHSTSFQYAHSKESDFLSRGYSFSTTTELNKRNTGINYGVSFINDLISPSFFDRSKQKDSWDYFLGVSQVVDPNTVVALNFTYSVFDGFLSDPYKIVLQETEILPGLSLPLTFQENRPDNRIRRIWYTNVKRFFPEINGSLDFGYRYFSDTWGIDSHTFDFEWYQKFGERWIVRPNYRYYKQSAADFYTLDLTGEPFAATEEPSGLAPFYSADYRLAKMDTSSYGLKVIFKINETFSLDAAFERYEMEGRDGKTPQSAFPDADILTLGGVFWF